MKGLTVALDKVILLEFVYTHDVPYTYNKLHDEVALHWSQLQLPYTQWGKSYSVWMSGAVLPRLHSFFPFMVIIIPIMLNFPLFKERFYHRPHSCGNHQCKIRTAEAGDDLSKRAALHTNEFRSWCSPNQHSSFLPLKWLLRFCCEPFWLMPRKSCTVIKINLNGFRRAWFELGHGYWL